MYARKTQSMSVAGAKAWWQAAKFGVFLHWTPSALPEARLPEFLTVEGRQRLPGLFHPRKFDADAWMRAVKQSGARYVVITAKHVDGLAMFRSRCNAFNIVEATPFQRDTLRDVAQTCRRAGLRFGIYYTQDHDQNDPGGAWYDGTDYASSPEEHAAFHQRKVLPQVRELLTQYGPVDVLWFDHPKNSTRAMSERLDRLVRRLQPKCVVGGRLTFGLGDFYSCGDCLLYTSPSPRD